jgi:hypothetical protein
MFRFQALEALFSVALHQLPLLPTLLKLPLELPLPPGRAEALAEAFFNLQEVPKENLASHFSLLAGFPVGSVPLDCIRVAPAILVLVLQNSARDKLKKITLDAPAKSHG